MAADLKLRVEYMLLEEQYRKLEQRVAEMEAEFEVGVQLGTIEKIKNISVSLLLLRKDRERLASELGLSIADYTSAKTLIEDELERVIYENRDIINQLTGGQNTGVPEGKVVESGVVEVNYSNVGDKGGVEAVANSSTPTATTATVPTDVTPILPKKRGRRKKTEEPSEVVSTPAAETPAVEIVANESVQQAQPVPPTQDTNIVESSGDSDSENNFDDLEAAMNMWN